MIKILFYSIFIFQINQYSQPLGEINGTVKDLSNCDLLVNASIKILNTVYETRTDPDGKFVLQNIPVGIYSVEASYIGYNTAHLENIEVKPNKSTLVSFELSLDTINKYGVLDSATISFVFYPSEKNIITQKDIEIEYKDSIFNYSIFGSDFFIDEYLHQPHTIKYETCRDGFSSISFKLIKNGKIISTGNLSLPLEKDWDININFFVMDENPINGCFGCRGYKVFPVEKEFRKSENDSLYVIWSGNYIANPVVY